MPSERQNQTNSSETIRKDVRYKTGRFHEDDKSHFAVTVGVSQNTAYAFFRDFKNLALFMKDLESVEVVSPTKSHWVIEVKGLKAEWDAEIVSERPGEMLAWKSAKGSEVETSGAIWFSPAPQSRGTVISLSLNYNIPGGKFAEVITKMSGEDPNSLAFINLRRLKCYLETGEVATVEGQPSGRDDSAETVLKH